MNVGRLLLRASIGSFFIGHGTQKLFGWFGGHGIDGTAGFFESIGIKPGRRNAIAAGAAEAGGGALLAAGAATPLAAASLIGVMLTAIRTVHLKNGPWVTAGGYEYNAVLIAALVALAEVGPGKPSIDELLGKRLCGPRWAIAAAAAGAIGSAAVLAGSNLNSADEEAVQETEGTQAHEVPAGAVA